MREYTRWGDTQLKIHLARLTELEYLLVHRGGRGQSFEYELLYDGRDDAQRHLSGLIDVEALRCAYDGERSGQHVGWSGSGRPAVGVRSGGSRVGNQPENIEKHSPGALPIETGAPIHGTRANGHRAPYVPEASAVAAAPLA